MNKKATYGAKVLAVASASVMTLSLMAPNGFAEESTGIQNIVGVNTPSATSVLKTLGFEGTQTPQYESVGYYTVELRMKADGAATDTTVYEGVPGVTVGLYEADAETGQIKDDTNPDKTITTRGDGKAYFVLEDGKSYRVAVISAPTYTKLKKGDMLDGGNAFKLAPNTPTIQNTLGHVNTLDDDVVAKASITKDEMYNYDATKVLNIYSKLDYTLKKQVNPAIYKDGTTGVTPSLGYTGLDDDFAKSVKFTAQIGTTGEPKSINGLLALDQYIINIVEANRNADGNVNVSDIKLTLENPIDGITYVINNEGLSKDAKTTTVDISGSEDSFKLPITISVDYNAPYGLGGKDNVPPVLAQPVDKSTGDTSVDDLLDTSVLTPLTGEAESIMNRIYTMIKEMPVNASSATYKTMEDELQAALANLRTKYAVATPFDTVRKLKSVYPYGLTNTKYGYATALDTDNDGIAGEDDGTTDLNMNKSIFELNYERAFAREGGTAGSGSTGGSTTGNGDTATASGLPTTETFKDNIALGLTKADYRTKLETLKVTPVHSYAIGGEGLGEYFELDNGAVFVGVENGKVTLIRDVRNESEAQVLANDLLDRYTSDSKQKVTLATFNDAVKVGITGDAYLSNRDRLGLIANAEYSIGKGDKAQYYELQNGNVLVGVSGNKVTFVKDVKDAVEAKAYAADIEAIATASDLKIADLNKLLSAGMSFDKYLEARDSLKVKPVAERTISDGVVAFNYQFADGVLTVVTDGQFVRSLQPFDNQREANEYIDTLVERAKEIDFKDFNKDIFEGMTFDSYIKARDNFSLKATTEYSIGEGKVAHVYSLKDSIGLVGTDGKNVTFVKEFTTLAEAKAYAESLVSLSKLTTLEDFKKAVYVGQTVADSKTALEKLAVNGVAEYPMTTKEDIANVYALADGFVLVAQKDGKISTVESFKTLEEAKAFADASVAAYDKQVEADREAEADKDSENPLAGDDDNTEDKVDEDGDGDIDDPVVDDGESNEDPDEDGADEGVDGDEAGEDTESDIDADGVIDSDEYDEGEDAGGADDDNYDDSIGTDEARDTAGQTDSFGELASDGGGTTGGGSTVKEIIRGGGGTTGGGGGYTTTTSGGGDSSTPSTKTALLQKYLPQTGGSTGLATTGIGGAIAAASAWAFARRRKHSKKAPETKSLNDLMSYYDEEQK